MVAIEGGVSASTGKKSEVVERGASKGGFGDAAALSASVWDSMKLSSSGKKEDLSGGSLDFNTPIGSASDKGQKAPTQLAQADIGVIGALSASEREKQYYNDGAKKGPADPVKGAVNPSPSERDNPFFNDGAKKVPGAAAGDDWMKFPPSDVKQKSPTSGSDQLMQQFKVQTLSASPFSAGGVETQTHNQKSPSKQSD